MIRGVTERKTTNVSMFVCCSILMFEKSAAKKQRDTPAYGLLFSKVISEISISLRYAAVTIDNVLKES